jgi:hypothetical protein
MADDRAAYGEVQENPLIADLLARGAESATMLQGYIGPSTNDDVVRLYPRLNNLRDRIDIPRSDIIHVAESPRSGLGGVIVWVKRDVKLDFRRIKSTEKKSERPEFTDVQKGRLRMQVRAPRGSDVCTSVCDTCMSRCLPCNGSCVCDGSCIVDPE